MYTTELNVESFHGNGRISVFLSDFPEICSHTVKREKKMYIEKTVE